MRRGDRLVAEQKHLVQICWPVCSTSAASQEPDVSGGGHREYQGEVASACILRPAVFHPGAKILLK